MLHGNKNLITIPKILLETLTNVTRGQAFSLQLMRELMPLPQHATQTLAILVYYET